jgi:NTP pyrophosphatase (non-canonical NTP hydrolase)
MLTPDQWSTVRNLVAWIDRENGRDPHEITMRILKISEEAGEVATAYIGMTGQNPRKGVTHSRADVEAELCDVILTAAVALASITDQSAAVLDGHLAKVAGRAAALNA